MKPDELVAFYAAHGIDLPHVAGSESNTHGIARKRRMSPAERKLAQGRPVTETAEGTSSRIVQPRVWSHAEVGICAGGMIADDDGNPIRGKNGVFLLRMPRMPWLAACYSFAGDRDGYKELHRGLTLKGLECAKRGHWQWQIELATGQRTYYLERLAELVLDNDACRPAFLEPATDGAGITTLVTSPQRYAIYMGVTEPVWQKPLAAYFADLQASYQGWLSEAKGVIGQWLRTEDLRATEKSVTFASEPSNAA